MTINVVSDVPNIDPVSTESAGDFNILTLHLEGNKHNKLL